MEEPGKTAVMVELLLISGIYDQTYMKFVKKAFGKSIDIWSAFPKCFLNSFQAQIISAENRQLLTIIM